MSADKFLTTIRDKTITPLVCILIFLTAGMITAALPPAAHGTWLESVVIFYWLQVLVTLMVLYVLRKLFPFREGILTLNQHPWEIYRWNLYGFLCVFNLHLLYVHLLIPIPLRGLFYLLLGAKIGKGTIALSGRINEPHLVEIGENVVLGDDSYISPHSLSRVGNQQVMIIKKIIIKDNAIIGSHSILSPGVIVESGAVVPARELVPMNGVVSTQKTKIVHGLL